MANFFSALLYYLILIPLSKLPLVILYVLSDLLYLVFLIFPYRKKVILKNLQMTFPEKSKAEYKRFLRGFYRYFSDILMEDVKLLSASENLIQKKFLVEPHPLLEQAMEKNKPVILLTSHYANWEYTAKSLGWQFGSNSVGLYQPLNNTFFNRKVLKMRGRSGSQLMPAQNLTRYLITNPGKCVAIGIIADQSPGRNDRGTWVPFLNRQTLFHDGAARLAERFGLPVFYGYVRKIKRGHYVMHYELITLNASETGSENVVKTYASLLEEQINKSPVNWLWSHRRWKHTYNQN